MYFCQKYRIIYYINNYKYCFYHILLYGEMFLAPMINICSIKITKKTKIV